MKNTLKILIIFGIISFSFMTACKQSADNFCERISQEDIQLFSEYDYNKRTYWTNLNYIDSTFVYWAFDKNENSIYINFNFNSFNKRFQLPISIVDSISVNLRPNKHNDSTLLIQIGNNRDKDFCQIMSVKIGHNKINPFEYLKHMDKRKDELSIIDIHNSVIDNSIRFYISKNDKLIYIPDSIEYKYITRLDSSKIDSLSHKSLNYIRENFKMITKNWFYQYDKEGIDY